jgi:sugar phosphate isomerase/epimerase
VPVAPSSSGKETVRPLGTMVIYGFPNVALAAELTLAHKLGATLLEILPEWRSYPEPSLVRTQAADRGLSIHSAHGCWGGRTICAQVVDLGTTDPGLHRESIDDLKRCIDWLHQAGGKCLVVHPGGLSSPDEQFERRASLSRGLLALGEHARGAGIVVCVENMPPGVHPGSRMADLAEIVAELDHPHVALALDTGHANLGAGISTETVAAGSRLATTHVHDNNGRQDSHEPPGHGTIDWSTWGAALDSIAYHGPIILECIRHIRHNPTSFMPEVLQGIAQTQG